MTAPASNNLVTAYNQYKTLEAPDERKLKLFQAKLASEKNPAFIAELTEAIELDYVDFDGKYPKGYQSFINAIRNSTVKTAQDTAALKETCSTYASLIESSNKTGNSAASATAATAAAVATATLPSTTTTAAVAVTSTAAQSEPTKGQASAPASTQQPTATAAPKAQAPAPAQTAAAAASNKLPKYDAVATITGWIEEYLKICDITAQAKQAGQLQQRIMREVREVLSNDKDFERLSAYLKSDGKYKILSMLIDPLKNNTTQSTHKTSLLNYINNELGIDTVSSSTGTTTAASATAAASTTTVASATTTTTPAQVQKDVKMKAAQPKTIEGLCDDVERLFNPLKYTVAFGTACEKLEAKILSLKTDEEFEAFHRFLALPELPMYPVSIYEILDLYLKNNSATSAKKDELVKYLNKFSTGSFENACELAFEEFNKNGNTKRYKDLCNKISEALTIAIDEGSRNFYSISVLFQILFSGSKVDSTFYQTVLNALKANSNKSAVKDQMITIFSTASPQKLVESLNGIKPTSEEDLLTKLCFDSAANYVISKRLDTNEMIAFKKTVQSLPESHINFLYNTLLLLTNMMISYHFFQFITEALKLNTVSSKKKDEMINSCEEYIIKPGREEEAKEKEQEAKTAAAKQNNGKTSPTKDDVKKSTAAATTSPTPAASNTRGSVSGPSQPTGAPVSKTVVPSNGAKVVVPSAFKTAQSTKKETPNTPGEKVAPTAPTVVSSNSTTTASSSSKPSIQTGTAPKKMGANPFEARMAAERAEKERLRLEKEAQLKKQPTKKLDQSKKAVLVNSGAVDMLEAATKDRAAGKIADINQIKNIKIANQIGNNFTAAIAHAQSIVRAQAPTTPAVVTPVNPAAASDSDAAKAAKAAEEAKVAAEKSRQDKLIAEIKLRSKEALVKALNSTTNERAEMYALIVKKHNLTEADLATQLKDLRPDLLETLIGAKNLKNEDKETSFKNYLEEVCFYAVATKVSLEHCKVYAKAQLEVIKQDYEAYKNSLGNSEKQILESQKTQLLAMKDRVKSTKVVDRPSLQAELDKIGPMLKNYPKLISDKFVASDMDYMVNKIVGDTLLFMEKSMKTRLHQYLPKDRSDTLYLQVTGLATEANSYIHEYNLYVCHISTKTKEDSTKTYKELSGQNPASASATASAASAAAPSTASAAIAASKK